MEIYFVRHGETNGNLAHRHQLDNTPLTFLGEEQARTAAKKVAEHCPTHLITSRLIRAIETARVIAKECDLSVETSEHFIELDRPKALYGQHHTSLASFLFYIQWYFGFGAGKTKGESYAALRARIEAAKEQLGTYPADARILVVSHTVFINFFVAHLCRRRGLGPLGAAKAFHRLLTMQNGQVIKITFDQTRNNDTNNASNNNSCAWSVEQIT